MNMNDLLEVLPGLQFIGVEEYKILKAEGKPLPKRTALVLDGVKKEVIGENAHPCWRKI